tara:strand:- start:1282 stop:1503 length:222 start_codon:yes stop_codon:yes gene_type:complete
MEFSIDLLDLIGYVVGTIVGLYMGFRHGLRKGAESTIIMLCDEGFVKYEEDDNGLIRLNILDDYVLKEKAPDS